MLEDMVQGKFYSVNANTMIGAEGGGFLREL